MITFAGRIGNWLSNLITGSNNALEGLESFYHFLSSVIDDLKLLFDYVLQAHNTANEFITTLPNWLRPYAVVTVSVLILYIVVGRNAGARGR